MFAAPTVIDQLHEAVDKCRHGRHFPDCDCAQFRHGDAPYCTAEEWRYSRMVDILLSRVIEAKQGVSS